MGGFEDVLVFDGQAGEVVDVEEPAVVDLVGGDAPVRQAEALAREQVVERVELAGVAGGARECGER